MSTNLVKRLKLHRSARSSTIELAKVSQLLYNTKVPTLSFSFQRYKDRLNFEVMPLFMHDMILAQTWLYKYDLQISFRNHSIKFVNHGQHMEIYGAYNKNPTPMISPLQAKWMIHKRHCTTLNVFVRAIDGDSTNPLQQLLIFSNLSSRSLSTCFKMSYLQSCLLEHQLTIWLIFCKIANLLLKLLTEFYFLSLKKLKNSF